MTESIFSNSDLCSKLLEYLDFDTIVALKQSNVCNEDIITAKHLFFPYLSDWKNRQQLYGYDSESVRQFGWYSPEGRSTYTLIPVHYKYTSDPNDFMVNLCMSMNEHTFDKIDCYYDISEKQWIAKMTPIHIANKLNEDYLKQDADGNPMTYRKPRIKIFDGNDIENLLFNLPGWIETQKKRIFNLLHIKTKMKTVYDSDDSQNKGFECLVGEDKNLCLQNMIKKWYVLDVERDYTNRARDWDFWFALFGEIDESIMIQKLKKTNVNFENMDALFIVFQVYMHDAF
eukprot:346356_1